MINLSKLIVLLPMKFIIITTLKSKDEIITIFTNEIDRTWYVDLRKRFRGIIKNDKIHLWNNIWLSRSQQHYYINFVRINKNNESDKIAIKIFGRNRLLELILYILFMIIGILGIIKSQSFEIYKLLFIILWMTGVYIIGNILPRYVIDKDIEYLKKLIE